MWHRYALNKLLRSAAFDKEEKENKAIYSYKILSDEEYKLELMNKFHEEALEVISAKNNAEIISEIGDCYEVIDEILKTRNITKQEVLNAQKEKREIKGGFDKKIFVSSMQCDDRNPLHKYAFDYVKDKNQAEKYKLIGKYDKHIVDFIITNEAKDKIYVQKRSATRKTYPNCWELPGGTVEINEIVPEAIERELKEELNLALTSIDELIHEDDCIIGNKKCIYSVFLIKVSGWDNFKLEKGKADEFKWIGSDETVILNINREDGKISPVYQAALKFLNQAAPS